MDIRIDLSAHDRFINGLHSLSKEQRSQVTRGVLNDVGDAAYTGTVRRLSKLFVVQQKVLREKLNKRGAYNRDLYEIEATGDYLSLINFKAKQTPGGVIASPWGVQRVFPHTFIATVKAGKDGTAEQVFVRKGAESLPIKKLWGPALPVELVRPENVDMIEKIAADMLPRRLAYRLDRAINRIKKQYRI
jgi:hypothetical protein